MTLTLGFAYLLVSLKFNGTAIVDVSSWNISSSIIDPAHSDGGSIQNSSIDANNISFSYTLDQPGDYVCVVLEGAIGCGER